MNRRFPCVRDCRRSPFCAGLAILKTCMVPECANGFKPSMIATSLLRIRFTDFVLPSYSESSLQSLHARLIMGRSVRIVFSGVSAYRLTDLLKQLMITSISVPILLTTQKLSHALKSGLPSRRIILNAYSPTTSLIRYASGWKALKSGRCRYGNRSPRHTSCVA